MRLKDKVCVITGGGSGMGATAAILFAKEGAKIVVADVAEDAGAQTLQTIKGQGGHAIFVRADVTRESDCKNIMNEGVKAFGGLDVLYNNAGIFPRARALDIDLAEWDEVLRVNLTGTFVTARAVAARMKDLGRGAIVNTASGRALAGAANGAHYSASKGGIIALTKSLALDWAGYGIRVNCVIPGLTDTAQPRVEMGDNELYAAGARIPMGRIGRPEDIAAVVAFLLSDDAGYMTGQSVAANGGAIMTP